MAIKPIEGFYVHDESTDTDGVALVSTSGIYGSSEVFGLANLFDPNSIVVGMGAGGGNTPTRALSGAMYVPNGAYVQALSLPSNIKYDVEYYDTDSLASPKGSTTYFSDNRVVPYTSSYPYIRILFAGTDNRTLSESDLVGLVMKVTLKEDEPYTQHLTAYDAVARQEAETAGQAVAAENLVSGNINSSLLWETGAISTTGGGNAYNAARARTKTFLPTNSEIVTVPSTRGFYVLAYNVDGTFVGAYKEGGTFVTDGSENGYSTFNIGALQKVYPQYRFRLSVYPKDGNDIQPSEFDDWTITNGLLVADISKVRVIQYNIGKFNMGSSGGLATNVEQKIANYKEFFGDQKADFVFLQEYVEYIDRDEDYNANDTLFAPVYFEQSYEEKEAAIKSQYPMTSSDFSYLHTSGDPSAWCIYGNASVGNKSVAVVSAVLNVTSNQEQKIRALTKLVNTILGSSTYAIVGMDTNVLSENEADALRSFMETNGFTCANWAHFGYKDTYNLSADMYHAIDNVFVKGDAKIVSFSVPDVYADLSSDHFPVVADIILR